MALQPQYIHYLLSSVYLWADNQLVKEANAYNIINVTFHLNPDSKHNNLKVFSSKYHQIVYNTDVMTIPSSVTVNGVTKNRGDDGLRIDFNNGRVLFDQAPDNGVIQGSFPVKDFNLYMAEEEEELLVERAFETSQIRFDNTKAFIPPYTYASPCIFVIDQTMQNKPFAYGGQDLSENSVKFVVIADSQYLVKGAMSLFADRARTCFPIISNFDDMPLDFFGDIKGGIFRYSDIKTKYQNNLVYIHKVYTSNVFKKEKNGQSFHIGFIEFDFQTNRYPRLN